MLKEFKEFAMKGNVVDLAVGVVIGTAFGKIVTSLVTDVIMPPLGLLTGSLDFKDQFINLSAKKAISVKQAADEGIPILRYGAFLNNILDFILVAFAIFMLIRVINRLRRPAPPPPPATKDCPQCAMAVPIKAVKCGHCQSALS